MKRFFCLVVFFVICFICSGCFQARTDLTISEDGSVRNNIAFVGVDLLKDQIEDLKNSLVQNTPTANVTNITLDNMSGYNIEASYPSIEEFANSGMKFYLSQPGKCKGIQQHKGIFFDEYYFDLFVENNGSRQENNDEMANAFLSQVKFDFNINLPYTAESHNADTSLNENKSLSWNLKSTLAGNEDRQLQFRFKIWHKLNCIIAATIIFLLLSATLFFIFQTKKLSEENELSSVMTKIKIFGISTIALVAATAYMLLVPVEFTDDDIISRTVTNEHSVVEESKNSSLENKKVTVPVERPKPASPNLGEHWIKDDKTNIYIWNPEPSGNEKITWSGGYIQDGDYKFAEGSGKVTWYRDGQVIQVDEGTFSHGKHHGQFKHTFKSGNVEYSNWNHGEEIPDVSSQPGQYVGTYNSGMKAYIVPGTMHVSSDRRSCNVRIIAIADNGETTYLDYRIWLDGNSLHFSNSEGYSGLITPTMDVENKIWDIARSQ